jgi:hypothetical protein
MFPGNSNSQFASPWNMTLGGIQPTDMRGVGSTGPFDLPAGGKVSFDVALITGPHDSTLNESMVAKITAQFRNGKFENFKGTIPNIVGPKQVATSTNVVNYSVSLPNANNTFLWTVTNGIIQSGQGTNSIDVDQAECFHSEDKQMILTEIVQKHQSTQVFNEKIKIFRGI